MRDIRFNLNYIKKNFDLNKFLTLDDDDFTGQDVKFIDLLAPLVFCCANKNNVELKLKSAWPKKPLPKKNENDIYEDGKGFWHYPSQESECESTIFKYLSRYLKSVDYKKDKIDELIYQGKLFSEISDNFKLEYYVDDPNDYLYAKKFGCSHSLIRSKKNSKFYYIFCAYNWDNKKHRISKIKMAFCFKIYKKKLTKKEFFKALLDKKINE